MSTAAPPCWNSQCSQAGIGTNGKLWLTMT